MASSPSSPICQLIKHPTILKIVPNSVLVSSTRQLCLTWFSWQRSEIFLMQRWAARFFLRQRVRWERKQSPLRLRKRRLRSLFLIIMQLYSACYLKITRPSLRTFPREVRTHRPSQINQTHSSSQSRMSMLLISVSANLHTLMTQKKCYLVERGCSGQASSNSSDSMLRKHMTSLLSLSYMTVMPRLVVLSSMSVTLLSFLVNALSSLEELMLKILKGALSSKTMLNTSGFRVIKQTSSSLSLWRSASEGAIRISSLATYIQTGLLESFKLCFSTSCSPLMKERQFLFSFLLVKLNFIIIMNTSLWRHLVCLSIYEQLYLKMTRGQISLEDCDGLVQELIESFPEDCHIFIDEVGPVEVALLDDEDQGQVLLHDAQCYHFVFLLVVELHCGLALAVLVPVLIIVQIRYVDKDVQDIRADIISVLVRQFFIVVADVQLGDEVEEVGLFDLGVIGEVVEQLADVGGAGYHLLYNLAEGFEDGGVIDGGEVKLNFFYIYLILTDFLLQFDEILIAGIGLREVDIGLIGEDEDGAVVGVLVLDVVVDIVEVIHGFEDVGLRTEDVDECGCVAEDHLLAGRRVVDIVLGRKVVQLEFYLLDLEVVGLHLAGLSQQFGGLGDHLLEDDLGDAAATRLGVAHEQDVHVLYNITGVS